MFQVFKKKIELENNNYFKNLLLKTKQNIKNKLIFFFITILATCLLCLVVYIIIINQKQQNQTIIPNFIYINIIVNTGVSFSMLNDASPIFVFLLQILLNIILIFIVFYLDYKRDYVVTLSVIIGGGLFNIFDRLINYNIQFSNGMLIEKKWAVLDYLQFGFDWFDAIFNIPDVCVVCGCLALLVIIIVGTTTKENTNDVKVLSKIDFNKDIIFFVDSCQKNLNIAISQEKKICASLVVPTNNNLTDIVFKHIDRLLKAIHIETNDINKLYITIGPGSYTGQRVCVLIAKTFLTVNSDIKLYAIDSLTLQSKTKCISALDARGNKFFYAKYNNRNIKINEIKIDEINNINKIANKNKMNVVCDYKTIDPFEQFIFHFNHFNEIKDLTKLEPWYIKKAI